MNRRLLSLLALVLATGLTALVVLAQDAAAPAGGGGGAAASVDGPIRIAICNPGRIFQDMQETTDLRQSMEAEGKGFMEKKNDFEQKIRDLQAAREQLKPDSPQYGEQNKKLLDTATNYKVWFELTSQDIQRTQKLRMRSLFDKIQTATNEVAQQKGLDLVIAEQKPEIPEDIDKINVDQLRAILNSRNVMYHDPRVDISNDVIAVLDSRYRAGK